MNYRNKIIEYLQKIDSLDANNKDLLLKKCPRISGGQKGVWFKYRENHSDNSYNLGFLLKLDPGLDEVEVRKAAMSTLNRHAVLRVFFYKHQNEVHMIQAPVEFTEIEAIFAPDLESVKASVKADYARPFELEINFPACFKIYSAPEGTYLSFVAHHIVVDGFSLGVIKNSIQSFLEGKPDLKVDNAFFESLRKGIGEEKKAAINFWEKYYEGFDNQTVSWEAGAEHKKGMALDLSRPLPAHVNNLVEKYVAKRNCLPYSVFNLALGMTMFKCKGISNFYIGSTLLNRQSERDFDSVGMYINTIKLKHQIEPYSTLGLAIQKLDQELLDVMEHGTLSYLEVMDEVSESAAMVPFQVVLEYQREGKADRSGPFLESIEVRNRSAKFDLSIFVTRRDDHHDVSLEFDSGHITSIEAQRFLDVFLDSVRWIVAEDEDEDEDERLVSEYFGHDALSLTSHTVNYQENSLSSLISSWASNSEHDLVILGKSPLTKRAFLEQVGGFATRFAAEESAIIPIWTTRNGLDLAMMTGAWVANKRFLAIDRNWPKGRLESVIEDLETNRIFSSAKASDLPDCFAVTHVSVPAGVPGLKSNFPTEKSGYVIYSSGTTGKPNGAIIPELAVLNLIYGVRDILKEIPFTRVAMNALFSFDASIQQFVLMFLNKSILILDEKERHDIDLLVEVLNREKIELLDGTPSFLKVLFQEDVFTRVSSLKIFLVGGEKLEDSLIRKINDTSGIKFYNVYGPCECAVDTTFKLITSETTEGEIGLPLGTTTFSVVDEDYNIMPKGQSGQLVIFGNSLGIGYLNRKDLTEKKFLYFDNDVLSDKFGYLTGDLGYIRADGSIVIKGRLDNQIKKNGARIELAEIINSALGDSQVRDACCYFHKDDQRIVLFVTPKSVDLGKLKSVLKELIPAYMMPEDMLALETFQTNNSGKLDLRSMYEQHKTSLSGLPVEVLELTRIQEELADIWKNHLKIPHVSDETDFFETGGNSLIAFKVLKDIRKVIKVKLNISQLFTNTTFSSLLSLIEQNLRLLSRNSHAPGSLIVPLKEEEAQGAQLFCIHAVGGSVGSYFKIAKTIKFSGAIFGVTGFASEEVRDIETYASALVSQMMSKDLSRGVWLLGWSFGGLLSLTVARQLHDHGIAIHGIFLVDSFFSPSKKEFEANFGLFSIIHTVLGKHGHTMDQELALKLSTLDLTGKNLSGLREVKGHLSEKLGIDFDLDDEGVLDISRLASYHRGLANTFVLKPQYLNAPVFAAYTQKSLDGQANDSQTLLDQGRNSGQPFLIPGDHYSIVYDSKLMNFINEKIGK